MLRKLRGFLANTSGNIAITGTLMLIPIMSTVGATIDYTRYVNKRNEAQASADAAILAAGRQIAIGIENEQQLKEYSKQFFEANLKGNVDYDVDSFTFEFVQGDSSIEPPVPDRIKITTDIRIETQFGKFLNVDEITETIVSSVTLGSRTVEVALVLDNSGSMEGDRISTLKQEAKNLVDIVFDSATMTTLPDPIKFSLVPFAGSVNIGAGHKNHSWMDTKGYSSVHHENLDWENTYRTNNPTRTQSFQGVKYGFQEQIDAEWHWKTRYDVFDMIGEPWGGCVEMRPWPHNVLDTSADSSESYETVRNSMDADGNGTNDGQDALFVPYFAPDEPDYWYARRYGNYYVYPDIAENTEHSRDRNFYQNNYLYDFQDHNPSDPKAKGNDKYQLHARQNSNSNLIYGNPAFGIYGSQRQIERTNWVFKYQRNAPYASSFGDTHGPNYLCTTKALNPLSTNRDAIKTNIDDMQAHGSTNIQQGLTWGWRTVSPGEPFTEGREYDDRKNMKFVIVLTDGNNFYQHDGNTSQNNTSYGAWGYGRPDSQYPRNALSGLPTHNRWIEGLSYSDLEGTIYASTTFDTTPESYDDFEKIMNAHTLQACNNVKNSGVTLYTIAFDVPNTGGVRELLEACAGSGIKDDREIIPNAQFYFDVDSTGLEDAMASIARQIANLRISE